MGRSLSSPEVVLAMTSSHRPHLVGALAVNIHETIPVGLARVLWLVDDTESEAILSNLGEEAHLTEGTTLIQKVNRMAIATSEPYFYWGADDTQFLGGWLENALAVVKENQGVVGLNNGHHRYDTAILSRDYIDRYGTFEQPGLIFHPGYKHYYCEVEMYHTAQMRGKLGYAPNAIVIHNHWGYGRAPKDETYKRAINWMPKDRELFHSRAHLWGGSVEHLGCPGQNVPI